MNINSPIYQHPFYACISKETYIEGWKWIRLSCSDQTEKRIDKLKSFMYGLLLIIPIVNTIAIIIFKLFLSQRDLSSSNIDETHEFTTLQQSLEGNLSPAIPAPSPRASIEYSDREIESYLTPRSVNSPTDDLENLNNGSTTEQLSLESGPSTAAPSPRASIEYSDREIESHSTPRFVNPPTDDLENENGEGPLENGETSEHHSPPPTQYQQIVTSMYRLPGLRRIPPLVEGAKSVSIGVISIFRRNQSGGVLILNGLGQLVLAGQEAVFPRELRDLNRLTR